MNTIEEMLTGQIEMSEFIALLKSDPTLQNEIRNLVPPEAAHNRSHPLWEQQRISYMAFQDCGYDFLRFVCRVLSIGWFNRRKFESLGTDIQSLQLLSSRSSLYNDVSRYVWPVSGCSKRLL